MTGKAHDAPNPDNPVGARTAHIPDHDLLQRIGRGGYGEVWLARNRLTNILRAVKLVFRREFEDERPYRREFEGLLKFEPISRSHPSQLAILHVGRDEAADCLYYVMELADAAELGPASDRGRDGGVSAAPPSEPDGPISGIRLSRRWGLFVRLAVGHMSRCQGVQPLCLKEGIRPTLMVQATPPSLPASSLP